MDNPVLVDGGGNGFDLDDLKAAARVTFDYDDDFITELGKKAQQHVQEFTGRVLVKGDYDYFLDRFMASRNPDSDFYFSPMPSGERLSPEIIIPISPVNGITSITYFDEGGTEQTLEPEKYQFDALTSRLLPAPGETWPYTQSGKMNAIKITFNCGYSEEADVKTDIPFKIQHALQTLVAYWYNNRESFSSGFGTFQEAPENFYSLLRSFVMRPF